MSGGWETRKRKCGKCGKLYRHTKQTCPNPAAVLASANVDSGGEYMEIGNDVWDKTDLDWQLEQEIEIQAA